MLNPSICFSTANGGLLLLIANSGFLINSLHGTLPTYVFSSYHILHMYTWWGFDHHLFLSSEGFGIVRTSELCLNLPFIMKTPSFFCKESLLQKPPLLFQTTPSFSAKKPPFIFATMKELLNPPQILVRPRKIAIGRHHIFFILEISQLLRLRDSKPLRSSCSWNVDVFTVIKCYCYLFLTPPKVALDCLTAA